VELLVVIAIIGILAFAAASALPGVQRSTELQSGVSRVMDGFAVARQDAITMNTPIEVRVYENGGKFFIMFYRTPHGGSTAEVAGHAVRLADSITFSTNASWSSLLTDAVSGTEKTDSLGTYHSFRFLPDGTTDLAGSLSPTLTVLYKVDAEKTALPPNFFTLQIDLQTGIIQTFRPS
jgi:uncharacterized protein (TIGR02596 family)